MNVKGFVTVTMWLTCKNIEISSISNIVNIVPVVAVCKNTCILKMSQVSQKNTETLENMKTTSVYNFLSNELDDMQM